MITKFIEAWILLPGLLVLLLLIAGLVLLGASKRIELATRSWGDAAPPRALQVPLRRTRTAAIVLIAASGLLYISSTEMFSRALMGRLERSVAHASMQEIAASEAIVVLGGGIVSPTAIGETGFLPPQPDLSVEAKARLVHAYVIALETSLPIILTGGRVFGGTDIPTEAETAARILEELGIDPQRIMLEERSRSTAENARYVSQRWDYERVAVVTSGYHMPRALLAFDAVGTRVSPAPTAFRADRRGFHPFMAMPSIGAFNNTVTVVRERIGYAWYRLTL
ncbi:MAG: YdcF family protein [Spirochaetales bacterium]